MDNNAFKMAKKLGIKNGLYRETLEEYIASYEEKEAKIESFAKGNQYESYLGLTPGENSDSDNVHRLGISKVGNSQ